MVSCDKCNRDVYMPFNCRYCGGYYCSEHRLPEFHACSGLVRGRGRDTINSGRGITYRPFGPPLYTPRRRYYIGNLFKFGRRELRDLLISLLIIALLPFTLTGFLQRPAVILGAVAIFSTAFLLHEIAHKFAAQKLGYWAEYRVNNFGLMLTLLSFISPLKLVAPGAVVIAGLMQGDDYGKIALSGPASNIAQALLFLVIGGVTSNSFLRYLSQMGIFINASLALFNLIPFGMFDGFKIQRWDRRVWLAAFVIAGLLFLYPQM
jgi:Zn-dependent protease